MNQVIPHEKPKRKPVVVSQSDIWTVIKPVIWLVRLCGYYVEFSEEEKHLRKGRTFGKWCLVVYCVITKVLLIFNSVRYVTIFFGETGLTGSLMASLAFFFFWIEIAYIALTVSWTLPCNVNRFFRMLSSHREKNNNRACYLRKLKWITAIMLIASGFGTIAMTVILSGGVSVIMPTVNRHMSPFDNTTGSGFVASMILYVVIIIVVGLHNIGIIVLFNTVGFCLYKEFACVSDRIQNIFDRDEDISEDELDNLKEKHTDICSMTQLSNNFVSHYLFAIFAFVLPTICFLVYGLIRGSLPRDEWTLCSFVGILCVVSLTQTIFVGAAVNDKAHEPLAHLLRANWSSYSDRMLHKVSLFSARLSAEKIGFSAYGLFIIDRSTILMICGTILTYAVVVLQVKPESGGDCSAICQLKNLNLTEVCAR